MLIKPKKGKKDKPVVIKKILDVLIEIEILFDSFKYKYDRKFNRFKSVKTGANKKLNPLV